MILNEGDNKVCLLLSNVFIAARQQNAAVQISKSENDTM
uniref:Uncharacterized protein n=1 Tax=Anguilla anguilla TaxID=7936 RepID=A0A0E9T6F6_ANGAN